jgi:hypothetical protein
MGEACPDYASCKRCRPDDSRGAQGHRHQQGETERCRGALLSPPSEDPNYPPLIRFPIAPLWKTVNR